MVKTRTHQQEKHFMSLVEKFPSNLVMTQMTSYCCNKLLMERLTLQSDVDCKHQYDFDRRGRHSCQRVMQCQETKAAWRRRTI